MTKTKTKTKGTAKGLKAAIAAAGSKTQLGARIGLSQQAISLWQQVPAERVVEIERITGIARERLRPDLYRRRSR